MQLHELIEAVANGGDVAKLVSKYLGEATLDKAQKAMTWVMGQEAKRTRSGGQSSGLFGKNLTGYQKALAKKKAREAANKALIARLAAKKEGLKSSGMGRC